MLLHVFVALGRALVIVECDAGRDHVEHHGAVVRDGRLQHGAATASCRRRTTGHKRRAQLDRQRAGIDRRQIVDHAGLQLRANIGGRRELALGQPVNAVVLDDVDHRQIAAHHVHELAHADRSGVAVAADAQRHHRAVGQQRAGRDRRHAAMHAVEAVRAAQEIGRALRRAADAGELHHALRLDAHLVERIDDALGDGVVAAARAKRRLAAAIVEHLQADPVRLWAAGVGVTVVVRHLLDSFLRDEFIGDGARIDRQPVEVADAAQLHNLFRLRDPASAGSASARRGSARSRKPARARDKLLHLARERISAQPQIIGLDAVLLAQLVAALVESRSPTCRSDECRSSTCPSARPPAAERASARSRTSATAAPCC